MKKLRYIFSQILILIFGIFLIAMIWILWLVGATLDSKMKQEIKTTLKEKYEPSHRKNL